MQSEIVVLSPSQLQTIIKQAVIEALSQKQEKQNEKQLLNFKETCDFLGIHSSTLNSWKAQHKIPFKKLGKRIFFDREEILHSLENFDTGKFNKLKPVI